jgi:hypothetical protein
MFLSCTIAPTCANAILGRLQSPAAASLQSSQNCASYLTTPRRSNALAPLKRESPETKGRRESAGAEAQASSNSGTYKKRLCHGDPSSNVEEHDDDDDDA